MNFWKKVDTELCYLGKTRKELANAIGFDVTNISFGIKRNSIPAADTALKVSRFLGVPLDYLLDMNEDENQNSKNPMNFKISEIENKLRRFSQNDLNAILTVVNALNEKY